MVQRISHAIIQGMGEVGFDALVLAVTSVALITTCHRKLFITALTRQVIDTSNVVRIML